MEVIICPRASNCILKLVKHFENYFEKIEIFLPINICYTVPLSLMYSKAILKFYDIDYNSLYPDFENLFYSKNSSYLENCYLENLSQNLIIFLCVIPYGNWDTSKLENTKTNIKKIFGDNIHIIWDCALVFPTFEILKYIEKNSSLYESFVFSFSYAKPLELGFGSFLLTKLNIKHTFPNTIDKNYTSFLVNKIDKKFKTYLNFEKMKNKKYSFICYNSELDNQDKNYILKIFEKIYNQEDFLITPRKSKNPTILNNLYNNLYSEIMYKKINNNQFFRENLQNLNLDHLKLNLIDTNPLSWRFNIRVDKTLRDNIINAIFKEGAFVSRLFPSLAKFFGFSSENFPNSSKHWQNIINIFNNQDQNYNNKILKIIYLQLIKQSERI